MPPTPVPRDDVDRHHLFALGVDLYEQHYFWEAHEVWEAAWREAPRGSDEQEALGALIQVAAGVLTAHAARSEASQALVARALERLGAVRPTRGARWRGVDIGALCESLEAFRRGGPWPSLAPRLPEILVVAGILVQGRTVLAARRASDDPLAGRWELPGGKVEAGEAEEAALARELHEELGIQAAVTARLGETVYPYPERRVRLVAWRTTLTGGIPRALHHDELRWLDLAELRTVLWAPADVPLLSLVEAQLSS